MAKAKKKVSVKKKPVVDDGFDMEGFDKDDLIGESPAPPPAPIAKNRAGGRPVHALDFDAKGVWLSVNQFCREAKRDRETTMRKINLGLIQPKRTANNQTLYKLSELLELIYQRDEDGKIDYDAMDPFRRKAHYASELDKLKLMTQSRQLIPVHEVEEKFAAAFKVVAHFLDTLPDILERDCGLTPSVLLKVEERIDAARLDLHKKVIGVSEEQVLAQNARMRKVAA